MSARRFSTRRFVVSRILRLLFTQADRFDLVVLDAEQGQRTLDGFGTLLAERQVVFAAAALVGIALTSTLKPLLAVRYLAWAATRSCIRP